MMASDSSRRRSGTTLIGEIMLTVYDEHTVPIYAGKSGLAGHVNTCSASLRRALAFCIRNGWLQETEKEYADGRKVKAIQITPQGMALMEGKALHLLVKITRP